MRLRSHFLKFPSGLIYVTRDSKSSTPWFIYLAPGIETARSPNRVRGLVTHGHLLGVWGDGCSGASEVKSLGQMMLRLIDIKHSVIKGGRGVAMSMGFLAAMRTGNCATGVWQDGGVAWCTGRGASGAQCEHTCE